MEKSKSHEDGRRKRASLQEESKKYARKTQLVEKNKRKAVAEDEEEEEEEDVGTLKFEDPFEDEFESDGEVVDAQGALLKTDEQEEKRKGKDLSNRRIFRPGVDQLGEDEVLIHDPSAYDMLHKVQMEWPALSFDFIKDNIAGSRNAYPMTAYCVLGTQADGFSKNKVTVMKLSQMHKTKKKRKLEDDEDSDDSDDSDSDRDENADCMLENSNIKHEGAVNRIRSMPQKPNVVATWSETGRVNIFDVAPCLDVLDRGSRMPHPNMIQPSSVKPLFSFGGHKAEGFAMDWSGTVPGRFLTGACNRTLMLWEPREDGRFQVDSNPFRGHTDSVEDLQWSPGEASVFASCSVDKTIRFWDIRQKKKAALVLSNAHDSDVNVISWNKLDSHLLVSGGDEGYIKIWDLRSVKDGETSPAASFSFHKAAITSVGWHPTESSMLAASSEDNTISLWDLAVERDAEEEAKEGEVVPGSEELPPQLMFQHMGQKHIKEIHWHPQLPSVLMSTAEDGLNIFRAADVW